MRTVFFAGCFVAVLSICTAASAFSGEQIEKTSSLIYENNPSPIFSSIGGEWAVFGLARSGYDVDSGYYEEYYRKIENLAKDDDFLTEYKSSDYARLVISLNAIGADPENVAGKNIITVLSDFDKTTSQGVNGPIWAVIALDSDEYGSEYDPVKNKYIEYILSCQNDDGGWSVSGDEESEVDITAMAATAIGIYDEMAVNRALEFLSLSQNDDGTYSSYGIENAESTAQVIVALSENDIPISDNRFIKNGINLQEALMKFSDGNGGFYHMLSDSKINMMATEQSLYAMEASRRADSGEADIFDTTDTADRKFEEIKGLPNKIVAIHPRDKIYDVTFSDIAGYKYENDIKELAAYGAVNGKSDMIFDPSSSMTRAEFASIIVNALCLDKIENDMFTDVNRSDWFFESVNTAYSYTIVNGVGDNRFDPNGVITKQEAAVMISRASLLCGINTELDETSVRNILAGFTDYMDTAEWARDSLAFCYSTGIFDDSDIEIDSDDIVERGEMAHMVYEMLKNANLI